MTEFGRSSISDALSNFSWSSVLPMTFAAALICRINSCSRRNTRIRLPSNWSVSCRVRHQRMKTPILRVATNLADLGERRSATPLDDRVHEFDLE